MIAEHDVRASVAVNSIPAGRQVIGGEGSAVIGIGDGEGKRDEVEARVSIELVVAAATRNRIVTGATG
jgi:hypothetical protein